MYLNFFIFFAYLCTLDAGQLQFNVSNREPVNLYTIEGLVMPPEPQLGIKGNWQRLLTLSVDNGDYKGFVHQNGRFVVSGVPSGSYILYIHHPDLQFLPVRIEINSKGKIRARKLNLVQPRVVVHIAYPLVLKPLGRNRYFYLREQWRILDVLLNPMVLIMVLPLILMMVLPRMINDPETKREIENIQFPKVTQEIPDLSELLTSFWSDQKPPARKKAIMAKTSNKNN
ncbi:ER membrane protein complex subunit 7 homolog [Scaptodrosophila lebanonensis]|uniref:ER membrane protein complex subunit 7 homolog n=1 Tax=Drosophila lebanonensis TaxID=7225 RepID=A0A6J2TQK2_DROLE|nr:ER membrane protein complex subunit 7 homolog [Scaptodrosophila lebanonensis]